MEECKKTYEQLILATLPVRGGVGSDVGNDEMSADLVVEKSSQSP